MYIKVRKEFCDLWIQEKRAGLNNSQYELIQNNPNNSWYYRPCKNDMFPCFGLSDHQFFLTMETLKNTLNQNPQQTGDKKHIMLSLLQKTTL